MFQIHGNRLEEVSPLQRGFSSGARPPPSSSPPPRHSHDSTMADDEEYVAKTVKDVCPHLFTKAYSAHLKKTDKVR